MHELVRHADMPVPRWHGLRVMAIDGSTLRMPALAALREHFGGFTTSAGSFRGLARSAMLYEVATGFIHDAVIGPYAKDERSLSEGLWDHLTSDHLLLLDRGFPSFVWFGGLLQRGIPFCARIDPKRWKQIGEFARSSARDAIVTLKPSQAVQPKLRSSCADSSPITVRVVKDVLPSGEQLVLVTSLLDPAIPYADLVALYQWRWRIEEGFKNLKSRLQLENWTGRSVVTIQQDFYAKHFLASCAALLAFAASEPAGNLQESIKLSPSGWRIKPNLTYTQSLLKHRLPQLLLAIGSISSCVKQIIELVSSSPEYTRPNRRYPRDLGVRIFDYHSAYKPCA